MFKLRVVQAKFGDCFIVIYGTEKTPKYLLIDGGPGGVYPNYLRPELKKINDEGGELELIILSHVDGDHIVGLINLTEELREQQVDGEPPIIKVNGLWMNSFSNTIGKNNQLTHAVQSLFSRVQNIRSTMPEGDLVLQSIAQGSTLKRNALILEIPVNEVVNEGIITNSLLQDTVSIRNLNLKVIGPNSDNLESLRKEWEEWIKKNEAKLMLADAEIMANLDKSVPNLSSIMFLMEAEGKSILFTGDGRGDFILEGLTEAGLIGDDEKMHVDVLKVPHHGSIRNATSDFFEKITADVYVVSGDGHHGNPEFETLKWIVMAAHTQKRKIQLICTNETTATTKILKDFPMNDYNYELLYLPKGSHSRDIVLA
ncbi:MAG TPA: MBL fold metallo-hydrolase [Pricia sp.]|nr:MBL fold metallo-hydrolase [Pricia sp.]